MISTAFVYIAYYTLNLLLKVFPMSTGFSTDVTNAFTQLGGYTAIINTLVPLETLATVVSLVISFELLIFAFKGIRFVFGYVPAVGGKG